MDLLFARTAFAKLPFAEGELTEKLLGLCDGCNGFDQVRAAAGYQVWVDPGQLERAAPERIKLKGGRIVQVNYVLNGTPWIESRLQDFWGMTETPKIGGVPVLVHLLAPNKRAVQMTQDLESFWKKLYPEIRGQLSRRYPKHTWP